jgi:lipid II:glycine glycyltransferase (peptidoglycan interpeptide bridge formation enzyme)
MLEFTTHNLPFFERKEIWFYNGEKLKTSSYTVFCAAKKLFGTQNVLYEKYQTSVINLLKEEEALFEAIHPTFRYDIRSAEKMEIKTDVFLNPGKTECGKLIFDYNLFAKDKGLPAMNEKWIYALQKKGNLCFSKAYLKNNEIATHVYIFDEQTISLSSSFHNIFFTDDKIRSAANKLLHWKDVVSFKNKGFTEYDFGGLNPTKLPGVSKFKSNFGGESTENFRFIMTSSFLFSLIKLFKKFSRNG